MYWKLLDKSDENFVDLAMVLDNTMKQRVKMGLGRVKSATPISFNMEEQMWSSGVLGCSNPQQLRDTVLFLLGINLALRCGEHKNLCRPRFNPQIEESVDSDGFQCLVYTSDPLSKTNQGVSCYKPYILQCLINSSV